jgi:hypothetical protein
MSTREGKIFIVAILVIVFVFLFACSGCATDFKVSGPTFSWRSGFGDDPAWGVASQPLGQNKTSSGSSSSAASMGLMTD